VAAAFFFTPLLRQRDKLDLGAIASWGLQGPMQDQSCPILGVWLFKGLVPGIAMDTSHCTTWDAHTRTLDCSFHSKSAIFGTDHNIDEETSPGPPVSSDKAMRLFSLLRYDVRMQFNERLTEARVTSVMFGSDLVGKLQEYAFIERLERGDVATRGPWMPKGLKLTKDMWVRNNYAQGLDQPPGTGYLLLPVLTPRGGVNEGNLAKAKAKAGPGQQALRFRY